MKQKMKKMIKEMVISICEVKNEMKLNTRIELHIRLEGVFRISVFQVFVLV